ncbi:MAG: prepilin-type N-terminal cleavage/methylation domain-containing protein [Candidatus Omnitrophica bacterium]|nr:prepilin-type N-terminal cleavage/methylation domain-containing protein [Candidatus Omnitrophota bacterium]
MRLPALRQNKGFTLIELLIASSLLVVIILALYTGFRVGALTHSTSQQVSDDLQGLRLFFDGLERDLRNCVDYDKVTPDSKFNGGDTNLGLLTTTTRFTTVAGDTKEIKTMEAVSYAYGNKEIFRESLPFSEFLAKGHSAPASGSAKAERICGGIEEFKITYLASLPSASDPDPAELDDWDAKSGVPAEVRITLVFSRGVRKIRFTRSIILPLNLKLL